MRYADTLTGAIYGFTTTPTERDRETLRLGADYQYDTDFVGAQMHTLRLKLQSRF